MAKWLHPAGFEPLSPAALHQVHLNLITVPQVGMRVSQKTVHVSLKLTCKLEPILLVLDFHLGLL